MSELTTTIRKILDQKGDLSKKYEDVETLFHLAVYQKEHRSLNAAFQKWSYNRSQERSFGGNPTSSGCLFA